MKKNSTFSMFGTLALMALMCFSFAQVQAQCGTSSHYQDYSNGYTNYTPRAVVAPLRVTVKAQPNPAIGQVQVIVSADRDFNFVPSVSLIAMDGRVVSQVSGPADGKVWEATMDLTSVNPGVYFLRSNCDNCKPVQIVVSGSVNP